MNHSIIILFLGICIKLAMNITFYPPFHRFLWKRGRSVDWVICSFSSNMIVYSHGVSHKTWQSQRDMLHTILLQKPQNVTRSPFAKAECYPTSGNNFFHDKWAKKKYLDFKDPTSYNFSILITQIISFQLIRWALLDQVLNGVHVGTMVSLMISIYA